MATDTQLDYYERIELVKQYIREHVDEPINRDDLARLVGFSVPHFHRIFTAHIGENMTAYVRRVRMERAAQQLRAQEANVTWIALDSGYETHSAFSKAFSGRWAVFQHVGPYDTLWQTWQAAYRDWLPTSGHELRDAIPFEDYVDDPSQIAPEKLRTEIFIPIK